MMERPLKIVKTLTADVCRCIETEIPSLFVQSKPLIKSTKYVLAAIGSMLCGDTCVSRARFYYSHKVHCQTKQFQHRSIDTVRTQSKLQVCVDTGIHLDPASSTYCIDVGQTDCKILITLLRHTEQKALIFNVSVR